MVCIKKRILLSIFVLLPLLVSAQQYESLINFGDQMKWTLSGGAASDSRFYTSLEQNHDGLNTFTGKLEYSFQISGNSYVQLSASKPIPSKIMKIRMWIKGDQKGAVLKLLVQDAKKEVFLVTLGKITWNDWKLVSTDFVISGHFGIDPKAEMQEPVSFLGLALYNDPGDAAVAGTILLDNLEVLYEESQSTGNNTSDQKATEGSSGQEEEFVPGVSFSGRAVMQYDDVNTSGSTNLNQFRLPEIRQTVLDQYVDLNMEGHLSPGTGAKATVRLGRGVFGWAPDRRDDYYNSNLYKTGFELQKMEITGEPFGFKNFLTIGKIEPKFSTFSLSALQYGVEWKMKKEAFTLDMVGSRPFSTIVDKGGLYTGVNDQNTYLTGLLLSYQLPKNKLSASVVNLHQNDGSFVPMSQFLQGHIDAKPRVLYFKMSDNSPPLALGGNLAWLKVYENNASTPSYSIYPAALPTSSSNDLSFVTSSGLGDGNYTNGGPGVGYRYTKGQSYFIYKLPIGVNTTALELDMNINNNYKVEISADGVSWVTVIAAPYATAANFLYPLNIRRVRINANKTIDADNCTTLPFYSPSGLVSTGLAFDLSKVMNYQNSGKTILTFQYNGSLLNTDINLEYSGLVEHRVKSDGTKENPLASQAVWLNSTRKFGPFAISGEVYNVTPHYDTSLGSVNTVDDQISKYQYFNGTPEIVSFIDENNNNIPDIAEDPVYRKPGLYIISDYFDDFADADNNGVRDDRQIDGLPMYKYKINRFGYGLNGQYSGVKNLLITPGYKKVELITGSGLDENISLLCEYKYLMGRQGFFSIQNRAEKIKDNIPDNLYNYIDPLEYKDNLLNTFQSAFAYSFSHDLNVHSRVQYFLNYRMAPGKAVHNLETLLSVAKTFTFKKIWELTPVIFSRFNRDVSDLKSFFNNYYPGTLEKNVFDNRCLVNLSCKILTKAKFFIGYQASGVLDYHDDLQSRFSKQFSMGIAGTGMSSMEFRLEYLNVDNQYHSVIKSDGQESALHGQVIYRF